MVNKTQSKDKDGADDNDDDDKCKQNGVKWIKKIRPTRHVAHNSGKKYSFDGSSEMERTTISL